MQAVQVENLHAGYGRDADILRGLHLDIKRGESIAILGASGGGKSTLIKVLAGLVAPRSGTVRVLGHTLPDQPPRGQVGYVPQRLGLVRHTSVLDNVVHGGLHETPWWASFIHRAPAPIVERSWEAIRAVGLEAVAHRPIHRLSGGQQRRAAIARSLVQAPSLLLADEFLGEMDPRTVETVMGAVHRMQHQHGTTAIFVEHQLEKAQRFADRLYRLEDGRLEALT